MENLIKGTQNKLEVLLKTFKAIEAQEAQIVAQKVQGEQLVNELSEGLTEAQESLKGITDIEAAKELTATIEELKKDIALQLIINENAYTNNTQLLDAKVSDFIEAHKALKTAYRELDEAVTLNLSLATLEQYKSLMDAISYEAYEAIGDVKRTLIKHKLMTMGEHSYQGYHLDQASLNGYAKYNYVVNALKGFK